MANRCGPHSQWNTTENLYVMLLVLTSKDSNCNMRSSRATPPSSGCWVQIDTLDRSSAFSLRSTKQITCSKIKSLAISETPTMKLLRQHSNKRHLWPWAKHPGIWLRYDIRYAYWWEYKLHDIIISAKSNLSNSRYLGLIKSFDLSSISCHRWHKLAAYHKMSGQCIRKDNHQCPLICYMLVLQLMENLCT